MKFLIIFLFFTNTWATEVVVKNDIHHFTLSLEEKKIEIQSLKMDLSIDRKKCNQNLFDDFHKRIVRIISLLKNNKDSSSPMLVIIDGKKMVIPTQGRRAQTLLQLPQELHIVKIKEELYCSQKG